jgi:hypothetical protein
LIQERLNSAVLVLAIRGCVLRRLSGVIMVSEAQEMARSVLAEALPRRWAHVQGVAGKAHRVAASLTLSREVLSLRHGCMTWGMRPTS